MNNTIPTLRLMLIDDDASTNFLHKRALRKAFESVEVTTSSDGQSAIDALRSSMASGEPAPRYIFLDINMPRLDGWGFLDEYMTLDEQWRANINLFVLTTSLNPDDHERADTYPVVRGVLDKIVDATRFQTLIESSY